MIPFRLDDSQGKDCRILCLGAHSDDIEIGCAATLHTLLESGRTLCVRWIVFGARGPREEEARRSAENLLQNAQQADVRVLDFRDGFFPYQGAAIKERFEEIKTQFDPDLVFTHRGEDRHQDHRVISDLTWTTFRRHQILEYEIPKYDGDLGQPNLFVPVDDRAHNRKIDLLMEMFGTQRDKSWFSRATFEAVLRLRGIECASPTGYAEGFHVRKLTLDLADATGLRR